MRGGNTKSHLAAFLFGLIAGLLIGASMHEVLPKIVASDVGGDDDE